MKVILRAPDEGYSEQAPLRITFIKYAQNNLHQATLRITFIR
jgi:hypothetical protein